MSPVSHEPLVERIRRLTDEFGDVHPRFPVQLWCEYKGPLGYWPWVISQLPAQTKGE